MGQLDTDYLFEVPCLRRLYAHEVYGNREMDIMINHLGRYADKVDAIVNPGMIPFECEIWATWVTADHPEGITTDWPNLPEGMAWKKFELTDDDREFLKKHPDCCRVYLEDTRSKWEVHEFYDGLEGTWEPVWEGPSDRTFEIRAYWMDDDYAHWGEYAWREVPNWAKKEDTK